MPLPTSYSETDLDLFMHQTLGDVGRDLGFTVGAYTEQVYDVLYRYGVDDIADADNMPRLRAYARVAAWQKAQAAASALYDYSDGMQSLKRSQIASHVKDMLAAAETEAAPYLAESGAG